MMSEENRTPFGNMLHKEFLDPNRMSQVDLAKQSDVDRSDITRMVHEGYKFKYDQALYDDLLSICRVWIRAEMKPLKSVDLIRDLLAALPKGHLSKAMEVSLIAKLQDEIDNKIRSAERRTTSGALFFGREQDIAKICEELRKQSTRLLTLTGPGGVGKTEVAAQVTNEMSQSGVFDVVVFVRLETIIDHALVIPTIARHLGVADVGILELLESLIGALKEQRTLLVLDNFEHLMSAAEQLTKLLKACPKLQILTTSRELLYVGTERRYRIKPLGLPQQEELVTLEPEDLRGYDAVKLFVERASANESGLNFTRENAQAIAAICDLADGLPLAIEIAAALITEDGPQSLYTRLVNRKLDLQISEYRYAEVSRHQRLEDMIAWSYKLLSDEQQRLFRRLAVFAGGSSLAAIAGVCNLGDLPQKVGELDNVARRLASCNLLKDENGRYVMLTTVREYAQRKLSEAGEVKVIGKKYQDYFLHVAEESVTKLRGPEQQEWRDLLEQELDNLRSALSWCLIDENGIEVGLRFVTALHWFWYLNGYWKEGVEWVKKFLRRADTADSAVFPGFRANALYVAGFLAFYLSDYDQAGPWLEESIALFKSLNDKEGVAFAQIIYAMSSAIGTSTDIMKLHSMLSESIHILRERGNKWGIAWGLIFLGYMTNKQDLKAARSIFHESQVLFDEVGEQHGVAWSFLNQGDAAWFEGEYDQAETLYKESSKRLGTVNDLQGYAWSLGCMGNVMLYKGNYQQAAALYTESLERCWKLGDELGIHGCFIGITELLRKVGMQREAACLLGATDTLYKRFSDVRTFLFRPVIVSYKSIEKELKTALGEDAFIAAWSKGVDISVEEAITYARMQTIPIRSNI